jgi:formate dehydrogenase subunit delta
MSHYSPAEAAQNLVHMANQISQFFQSQPNRPQALHDFAEHLRKFWAPTMRAQFLQTIDAKQAADLLPFAQESVVQNRAYLAEGCGPL